MIFMQWEQGTTKVIDDFHAKLEVVKAELV